MAKEIRHTAKDNLFRNMFGRTEYTIELYRALHPEDTTTKKDDIKICTLETMQSRGIYNDLGFLAGDKLIILVEEQSSWSDNIAIRSLLYLAYSYLDYIEKTDINLYGSTKLQLPKPELYVVYTKERENHPDTISIRKNIFPNEECCIDAEVKVLYKDNSSNIIDQYINYCFVYDEQTKLHGYTEEALKEIFRICIAKGYLREYLNEHRTEVIKMMDILFDQERQDRLERAALLSEGIGIGREEGIGIGREEGIGIGREEGIGIGREEGIGIGREEGIGIGEFSMLASLVHNNLLAKDVAASQLGITEEEFDKRVLAIGE